MPFAAICAVAQRLLIKTASERRRNVPKRGTWKKFTAVLYTNEASHHDGNFFLQGGRQRAEAEPE